MLYLSEHTTTEESRIFLYHLPTHTLAEVLFGAIHGAAHLLRIPQETPPADEALAAFTGWIATLHPLATQNLTTITNAGILATMPQELILASAPGQTPALIIHAPHLGFTAGIREDGSKIPPHWSNPSTHTREQKSHIIAQLADSLMRHTAAFIPKSQAT